MTCLPDLLWESKEGSPSASEPAFLNQVYDELHRLASSLLRHERAAHTLQTSALVNEAFLRLSAAHSLRVEDRQHFLRIAAHSMRQILIDYARSLTFFGVQNGCCRHELQRLCRPNDANQIFAATP